MTKWTKTAPTEAGHFVEVVEDATRKVVRRIGPLSKYKAAIVSNGLEINLNHERYSVRIMSEEPK